MKKLTNTQVEFIACVEKSITKLDKMITEARRCNLLILERQFAAIQMDLRNTLNCQLRSFRDDSLTDPEPLFPQGEFPYGRR